ncbi:MAG: hypothetical protein WAM56_13295 [Acidobacteriaceae bacterium]
MELSRFGAKALVIFLTAIPVSAQPQQAEHSSVVAPTTALLTGKAVPVSTAPGQDATFTFAGHAGQQMSLLLNDSTYPASCHRCIAMSVSILKPDDGPLGWTALSDGHPAGFLDSLRLPITGTYKIVFHSQGQSSGTVNATLYLFKHSSSVVDIGTEMAVNTDTPGQNLLLKFSGVAGQEVKAVLSKSTFGNCIGCVSLVARIVAANGSSLGWAKMSGSETAMTIPSVTLPSTGLYTVVIDPQGNRVGSVTLALTIP